VLTDIDASGLLTAVEAADADVLNGIAYNQDSDHFYLTGKDWPKLFEVSFPVDSGKADSDAAPASAATAAPRVQSASSAEAGVVRSKERVATCGCAVPAKEARATPFAWLLLGSILLARRRAMCSGC
jgi:hypothetical protein